VVPELGKELSKWNQKRDLFAEITNLKDKLSELLVNYDSSSKECPDIGKIKEKLKNIQEMDSSYSFLGSAFRSGSRQTYFVSQIIRYADIYASTCLNLLHYPFFYLFKFPPMLVRVFH
jgi:5'-nucleotidase